MEFFDKEKKVMEYITLDKGIPVWIPVYEASLQFRIAKLGGTLDSLLFMYINS